MEHCNKKLRLPTAKSSYTKGFTLLELLTTIGILSIIGVICVSVITITFRTSKKADLINFARQNGDTAMSQIVRNIRFAGSLISPATCVPSLTASSVTVSSVTDHQQTTYSCTNGTISSNSASLVDSTSLQVTSCLFICSQQSSAVPPIITIQYSLSPKVSGNFAETNFILPFQSSVTVRNY